MWQRQFNPAKEDLGLFSLLKRSCNPFKVLPRYFGIKLTHFWSSHWGNVLLTSIVLFYSSLSMGTKLSFGFGLKNNHLASWQNSEVNGAVWRRGQQRTWGAIFCWGENQKDEHYFPDHLMPQAHVSWAYSSEWRSHLLPRVSVHLCPWCWAVHPPWCASSLESRGSPEGEEAAQLPSLWGISVTGCLQLLTDAIL